jgi:2-octaprenyl-6-methoxyphenol hydroxylase
VQPVAQAVDVVIIGGGMVGASVAEMLSGLDITVALVESQPVESTAQPSFDARTTALSNGTRRILETLGVWDSVATMATPIRAIHISERSRFGRAVIDATEQGLPAMGYVLPNRILGHELWRRLRGRSGVHVFSPATVESVDATADGGRVVVSRESGPALIEARLIVAADGANSLVRSSVGVGLARRDYRQTAIVTSVNPGRFHDHVAYERFTSDGPVAVLPLADGRCAVVLTLEPADAEAAMALPDASLLALLQERFGWRLGAFSQLGRRDAYPLALTEAEDNVAPRTVLIGSAAQGLHPIAGQGFNLALRDAATLAEVIADTVTAPGADVGAAAVLERYAAWRARDRQVLISFTDGLVRLFAIGAGPLRFARSLGLLAFDLSPAAKTAMSGLSRGFAGAQPRLARGLPLRTLSP